MKNAPLRILRPAVRTLYSGPIKRIGDQLGLTSTLANYYWSLLYRISGDTVQHDIEGTSIEFETKTRAEFVRFENLMDEEPVINDLLSRLHSDDVFFDIGANVGVYTCFVSAVLSGDRVVAFEPHPANVSGLESNLELNGLSARIQQCALSTQNGEVELAVGDSESGVGTHSAKADPNGETITVPSRRGDTLVQENKVRQPSVVKIDVEGAEYDVIQGLRETLSNDRCRLVYCEVHPDRNIPSGKQSTDIKSFLQTLGFDVEQIYERDDEYFLRASK